MQNTSTNVPLVETLPQRVIMLTYNFPYRDHPGPRMIGPVDQSYLTREKKINTYCRFKGLERTITRENHMRDATFWYHRTKPNQFTIWNIIEMRKKPDCALDSYKEALCNMLLYSGASQSELNDIQNGKPILWDMNRFGSELETGASSSKRSREIETNEIYLFIASYAILVHNQQALEVAITSILENIQRGFRNTLTQMRNARGYEQLTNDYYKLSYSLVQFAIMANNMKALDYMAEIYIEIAHSSVYALLPDTIAAQAYIHEHEFASLIDNCCGKYGIGDEAYIEWAHALLKVDPKCIVPVPEFLYGEVNPPLLSSSFCRYLYDDNSKGLATLWRINGTSHATSYVPRLIEADIMYRASAWETIRNRILAGYMGISPDFSKYTVVFLRLVTKFHLMRLLANRFNLNRDMIFDEIYPMIFGKYIPIEDFIGFEMRISDLEKYDEEFETNLPKYPGKYSTKAISDRTRDLINQYWPYMKRVSFTKNNYKLTVPE